jgi:hypothetical protein
MKIILRAFAAGALLLLGAFASMAQTTGAPTLTISAIKSVEEIEPAIFEIVVALQSGSTARLQMNVFTLQDLANKLARQLPTR